MIFGLLRLAIWLAGVSVLAFVALDYFDYQVNMDYFTESKKNCQEAVEQCWKEVYDKGIEQSKQDCSLRCVEPKLLIEKKDEKPELAPIVPVVAPQ